MSRRPQPRITNRLRFTAYHEAGHAVVAFHEGTAIHKATIEPSEDRYGSVTYTNPSHGIKFDIDYTLRSRGRVRSLIRASLAGAIAQKMKYPRSYRSHHSETDDHTAAGLVLLIAINPSTVDAYMKLLNLQTKDILTSLWYQVEALAEALLERRSLNRKEVRKVIRDAMTDEIDNQ